MGERWYVAQAKSGQEYYAERELRQQGFPTFVPSFNQKITRAGTHRYIRRPLFSSYFFVSFDKTQSMWGRIANTRGVRTLVGGSTAEAAPPLPTGFVEKMLATCDENGLFRVIEAEKAPKHIYQKNMKIRVLLGSFKDLVGLVKEVSKKKITIILLLLGRQIDVTLPLNFVEPWAEPNSAPVR